jgi:hypothetical protein
MTSRSAAWAESITILRGIAFELHLASDPLNSIGTAGLDQIIHAGGMVAGVRALREQLAEARVKIRSLEERVAGLELDVGMACENTPTKDCECPGCQTARAYSEIPF